MKYSFTILFVSVSFCLSAQIGGNNVYEFLNLSQSPRVTALGGSFITVKDSDVSLAYSNPAATNILMDQQLTFGTEFYFIGTGITHGYAGYGYHLDKADISLHGGIQYMSYGSFDARDIYANDVGSFKASEFAITVGAGKQFSEKLSAGANVKIITSHLESYNSFGMSMDLAGMYVDTAKNVTASIVFKNVGLQFVTYDGTRESLPFEIQAGFSKKLKYLPLRLSVLGTNLQRWNITYDDPNQVDDTLLFGEEPKGTSKAQLFFDNFFRHIVFSAEFLFGKRENFSVRAGYNHLRRAELKLDNLRGLSGFSGGLGFKIKKFGFDYGIAFYHTGGTVHHLGISTNLNQFKK